MTHLSGASLEVRRSEPSVDLATLVECLADAVPLPGNPASLKPHQRWPLFTWKPSSTGGALEIDSRAVISRLTTSPKALERLRGGGQPWPSRSRAATDARPLAAVTRLLTTDARSAVRRRAA